MKFFRIRGGRYTDPDVFSGGGSSFFTDTSNPPPDMSGATVITLPNVAYETAWPAFDEAPAGTVYFYEAAPGEDVEFRFTGTTPLKYPVICTGGRHTRYVGLEFSIITQTGGDAWTIPHFPQTSVIQNSCDGIVYLEGILIEGNGHAGDYFVTTQEQLTASEARAQRDIYIINCHFKGLVGDANVHSDIFQTQNRCCGNVTVHNLTVYSGQEGFTLENFDGGIAQAKHLKITNFDFHLETRWNPEGDVYGAPVAVVCDSWEFQENYVANDFPGAHHYYLDTSGPWATTTRGPGGSTGLTGLQEGTPAGGEFAPEAHVGRNYISPYD